MKGASLLRINYDREETDSDGKGLRYFLAVEEKMPIGGGSRAHQVGEAGSPTPKKLMR